MKIPPMYYVWRRSDGYISASCYMPAAYTTGGSEPAPGSRPGSGIPVTFIKLGEFDKWGEAWDFIQAARQELPRPS